MAAPKRTLIVDDDATIRELLQAALRMRGLAVDVASDGAEALKLLRQESYAVVLLDLLMPNIDGFGVLEQLDSAMSMPVVLVISGADPSLFQQLRAHPIHGIVRKPFDPEALADIVEACVEIKSRGVFEAMAISAVLAGAPLFAWLNLLGR